MLLKIYIFVEPLKFGIRQFSSHSMNRLRPYVDKNYSYSYGSSQWAPEYKTIGTVLQSATDNFPERTAVISHHQGISKTFCEFNSDVNKLAKSLTEKLGFRKGDRLGIWSANCYEYAVTQLAFARIGAIHCPQSPLYKANELAYTLDKANIKALFMPSPNSKQSSINNFDKVLKTVVEGSTSLEHVIYLDGELNQSNFNDKIVSHSFEDLLDNDGKLDDSVLSSVDPDDPAAIFFTSGTTGKPKGATLSHFTFYNNARIVHLEMNGVDPVKDEIVNCGPAPLFHALAGCALYSLCFGFPMVLTGYRYSAQSFVEAFNQHQCTNTILVPTMIIDIINYCKVNKVTCNTLEVIMTGGASVPPEVCRQAFELFPKLKKLNIIYGATETGPMTTRPRSDCSPELASTTVGIAGEGIEVKLINRKTGKLVKHGEQGELLTRGHHIMQGYWEEPEKTAEVLKNGWYATGDMATMDSEGNFRIVGRVKELIIRGGSNIYPAEVEELLIQHPDVLQVGVCGLPHPTLGEEVCAWIQLTEGVDKDTVTPAAIREYCKEKISYYKIPQHILFVDSFPMTASGKFQKFKMTQLSLELLSPSLS